MAGATLRDPAPGRGQSKLREMRKVIAEAAALTGDLSKAILWFRNEVIDDYDRKTPADLVAEGKIEAVLAYLRDLESGARG